MSEKFYNVSFDIGTIPEQVVWEGVLIKESGWCYPREESAKRAMRQCYEDIQKDAPDTPASNSCIHADFLKNKFSEEKMYAQFIDAMGVETEFDVEKWVESLDIEEIK